MAELPPTRPREFIRDLAHDLINPLNSIDGFLRLLLDPAAKEPLTRRQRRMLVAMDRASIHLLGLVRDVSDLHRLETDEETLERIPVDLGAAARKAFEEHKLLADNRRIRLTLASPARVSVVADEDLVNRFFDALVRAAGRRTPEGGAITLRLEEKDGGVLGVLEHDGEALSRENADRLFNTTLSDPRPPEGYAALNLALCRRIAVIHGGDFQARAREGGGTAFFFRFPGALKAASARP